MNGEVTIRPAVRSDATEVAALLASQRQHLAPWDPRREPAFFTRGGQRARLSQVERDRAAGTSFRFLILEGGELAGEVSITNIVRRSFQSANVGYWVAAERCGRGVATRAVTVSSPAVRRRPESLRDPGRGNLDMRDAPESVGGSCP